MYKKLLIFCLVLVVVGLSVPVSAAVQSLGWWNEGDEGTTHQLWDFTPTSQNPVSHDQFYPEEIFNPNNGWQVFAQRGFGTYDGIGNLLGDPIANLIIVDLKINNYLRYFDHKEVWIDLGLPNGGAVSASLAATDHGVNFSVTQLPGPGPSGNADFGFYVVPNPYFENILISISGGYGGARAVLDYIHVDTICIPEPATVALLGLGGLALLRRKRAN